MAVLIYVHLVANVSNRLKPRIKLVVGSYTGVCLGEEEEEIVLADIILK